MIRNLLFIIEYDGSDFCGWQRQPNVPTVQGTIEKALSKLFDTEVELNGTSRTDAGVHALGQCASFAGEFNIPTDRILFAANNMLPSSVRLSSVQEMPLDFHARFDAKGKMYRYRIKNTDTLSVFDRNYVYHIRDKLDLEAMRNAAAYAVGTHDFKSFQASGGQEKKTTVRTIREIQINQSGDEITIDVTGDGFLYNMVRILVGTLIEAGQGRMPIDGIKNILEKKDRSEAGPTVPPQGLYLMRVYYNMNWE